MNKTFAKIDIKYLIVAIICIILVGILLVVKDETSWTQLCENALAIGSISTTIFMMKSKILDSFKRYRNFLFVILGFIVAGIYFVWGIYLWPIVVLILGIVINDVYKRDKNEDSEMKILDNGAKQLICLVVCFALLFSIDSYYRQSEVTYSKEDLEKSTYTRFEISNNGEGVISVSEFRDAKSGDYFNISYAAEEGYPGGKFRVFKEDGVKYETPMIINNNVYAEIIIKREGMDDLVYVIPY